MAAVKLFFGYWKIPGRSFLFYYFCHLRSHEVRGSVTVGAFPGSEFRYRFRDRVRGAEIAQLDCRVGFVDLRIRGGEENIARLDIPVDDKVPARSRGLGLIGAMAAVTQYITDTPEDVPDEGFWKDQLLPPVEIAEACEITIRCPFIAGTKRWRSWQPRWYVKPIKHRNDILATDLVQLSDQSSLHVVVFPKAVSYRVFDYQTQGWTTIGSFSLPEPHNTIGTLPYRTQ